MLRERAIAETSNVKKINPTQNYSKIWKITKSDEDGFQIQLTDKPVYDSSPFENTLLLPFLP